MTDAHNDTKPAHSSHSRPNNAALAAELSELLSVVEPSSVANMVLQRAFIHNATDIHLDPTTLGTRIRFRVDGVLQDILPIPADKATILLSRIKVMAGMDIAERRLPQDGAIVADRNPGLPRDIRVGSSPTVNGERLVLRLMPDPESLKDLSSLGFYNEQLDTVQQFLGLPHGLLLVVGAVGSGKTTTVYSLLRELNNPGRSVVTIEDPVERRLPGANQIQVDVKSGLTFVSALRGTLRQDPDIICIGEIRDAETAQIACRAATTGVLVLSTLHANDTASAIDVLRGFGIPSMTIADSLRGVIAQRLVRKVCPLSREEFSPDADMKRLLHLHEHDDGARIVRGLPTDENFNTGYSGRTATFETMAVSKDVRNAILESRPAWQIHDMCRDSSMLTLEDATRRKVFDKVTSIDELRRVMSTMR